MIEIVEELPEDRCHILRCAGCGEEFLGEPGKEYPAGVLCPLERSKGRTMVGVCHPTGETLPASAWKGGRK
jgi:hypothetical protein